MARMSIAERAQAVGMIRVGTSIRHVARLFNRRHFSIQRFWAKYVHTRGFEDLRRLPKSLMEVNDQVNKDILFSKLSYNNNWRLHNIR